jgi:secreted PhoX family phosphatase
MCAVDSAPLTASNTQRTVATNRFIEGDTDLNSVDNLAFQPVTGNLYVIEDHDNGDVWACLPDGQDRDIKSDGCVKILSVKDSSAEPTGYFFSPDGRTAYVSIQHSDDTNIPLFDGYPTDDVLKITGFKVKKNKK